MSSALPTLLVLLATAAKVPPAPAPSSPEPVSAAQAQPGPMPTSGSWLAAGAAVVPGVLLHGSGHFVLGDRKSAYRLLAAEGAGLLGVVGGIALLGSVGGSEKLAAFYVPIAVSGMGLFGASMLADIAGSLRGHRPWPAPFALEGRLALDAGYAGLYASKHTFSHLGRFGLTWRTERWNLAAGALLQPQLDFAGYSGSVGYLLWAPPGDAVTRLSLFAELGQQRFRSEGFTETTVRGFGELRWNLGGFLPTLRSAWLLGRLGWGFDGFTFAAASESDDGLPFLVADIGMGLMASERVMVEVAYRHRKGELPGGLVTPGGLDGFMGMLEARGRIALAPKWALLTGVKIGNGVLPWLSVESQLF